MHTLNEITPYTQQLKILYVEDDIHFQEETAEIFEDYFYHVEIASDGQEGLEKYQEYFKQNGTYYDIVITDINMPKMDGIELTKAIYKNNPNQAIIIISAHNESSYLLELINLGIEQFLMKPLEFDKMVEVLYKTSKKILDTKNNSTKIKQTRITLSQHLVWDTISLQLLDNNQAIKLTKKEMLLMQLLLKNKDKVTTIEEIFATLWEDDVYNATIESLKAILSRFRKKVPELKIENIYGLGYRLG